MKRGTPSNPKTKALARRLRIPLPYAVGLLDMLWEFAGTYARRGDIGRYSDAELADAMGWPMERDVAELIQALTSTLETRSFLDRSEEHRLIVHDWSEHADRHIHQWLQNRGESFADGWAPFARISKRTRKSEEENPGDDGSCGSLFGESADACGAETSQRGKRTSQNGYLITQNIDLKTSRARTWPEPEPEPEPVTSAKAVNTSQLPLPPKPSKTGTPPPGKANPPARPETQPPRRHGFEAARNVLAWMSSSREHTPLQIEASRELLLAYANGIRCRHWGPVDDTLAGILLDSFLGDLEAAGEYLGDQSRGMRRTHRKPGDSWGSLVHVLRDDAVLIRAWLAGRSREPPVSVEQAGGVLVEG